jgi:hypothetical protein
MKTKRLLILIAGLQLCLFSCKKPDTNANHLLLCCGANPPATSIFNKWQIVSDSTYAGVGINNHAVNYAGQPGDYFDIRTNDTIFTNEGAVLDTLSYKQLTDSTIVITSFGIGLNGTLGASHYRFSAQSMHIASPEIATPGGIFGRRITLSK